MLKPKEMQIIAAECQALARHLGDHQNDDLKAVGGEFVLKSKVITRVVSALLSAGNVFETQARELLAQTPQETPSGTAEQGT